MASHERPRSEGTAVASTKEDLSPDHFYAAYVFDQSEGRGHDVGALVEAAGRLGYPVRYWWLSEAVALEGFPDRLILCVHHPFADVNVGLDLYHALKESQIAWDDLEAAALEEYRGFGKRVQTLQDIRRPDGATLFPSVAQGVLGED